MKNKTFLQLTPLIFLGFVLSTLFLISCTENDRARKFGGTEEITLKENEVLVNITWKETNMWILTQDTITGIHYFREKSKWDLMNGKVVIKNANHEVQD
jgi:hypothetical protein